MDIIYLNNNNRINGFDMKRSAKIALCVIFLITGILIVGINFNQIVTVVGIVVSCIIAFYFIYCTDGLFTGYLENLNSDVPRAKTNVALLIRSSRRSVKIVSATLSPAIYCQKEVFSEIEEAKNRGVKFDIILSGKVDAPGNKIKPLQEQNAANFKKLWSWVKNKEIEVNCFNGDPWPHMIVVDDIHVRIEEKHKIVLYPDARMEKRRAKTHLLNPDKANQFSDKFKKLKSNSVPYDFSRLH